MFFLKLWTPPEAPSEECFEEFVLTPAEAVTDDDLPWRISLPSEEAARIVNLRLMRCGYRISFGLERWKDDNNTYLVRLQTGTLGRMLLK